MVGGLVSWDFEQETFHPCSAAGLQSFLAVIHRSYPCFHSLPLLYLSVQSNKCRDLSFVRLSPRPEDFTQSIVAEYSAGAVLAAAVGMLGGTLP